MLKNANDEDIDANDDCVIALQFTVINRLFSRVLLDMQLQLKVTHIKVAIKAFPFHIFFPPSPCPLSHLLLTLLVNFP